MLDFLYYAVSWVLLRWHQLFTAIGLPAASGANWALSIVFLVITARLLLFRLFIKQIHYQRHMQEMQPKIQKLREKHKNDRATLNQEMMKLQQEEGFNPLSGCLPLVAQFPVFIGLLHVLRHLANAAQPGYPTKNLTLYGFTAQQTHDAAFAKIFGGAPLAAALRDSASKFAQLGGEVGTTRAVIIVLVIVSAAATFTTQLLARAMQTTPPEGQAAMIQKLMLYAIPVFTLGSGLFFPLGVLIYWFTSNIWTAGQQAYVLRFHPHPSKANDAPVVGQLGKTARPAPGARPTRERPGRPAVVDADEPSVSLSKSDETPAKPTKAPQGSQAAASPSNAATETANSATAPGARPRPGQRPAKRPPQSKKRR